MEKAEKFIQDYTRNCSNEIAHWDIGGENVKPIYSPWLTPDQARRAVEIAREEVIEEISHWIEEHCYDYLKSGVVGFGVYLDYPKMINDLKKAMEDKV